jgi:DNA processing protein
MRLDEVDAYIALNSLSLIGPNNFHNLVARFGSCANAFGVNAESLRSVSGIGPKSAEQIAACKPEDVAQRERKLAKKENVRILTIMDDDYPKNLKASHPPPPVLYVAGELREEDAIAIAVVGTRAPTPYGKIMGENFSATLAKRGFTIVSGLARGIDSTAHRSAMDAGGRTIAVVGTGLDSCYPPENRELVKKIIKQGAVVSQFPFGTEPDRQNFPIRNRIISGLSLGVLVVEAGDKSGTLITAYGALEEGREVFAIPGRADSSKSIGCHKLIQKGAKLVMSPDDVVSEFPPEIQALVVRPESVAPTGLSGQAGDLVALLHGQERHIDFIIGELKLPSSVVLGILLELELKGVIRQLPGKYFAVLR